MAIDLKKARQREKRLLQRKAKLESDLNRIQKAARAAERKADGHRKVVLGAIIIKAVRRGVLSENSVRDLIEILASDRDKKALADLDFGAGETAVSEPPAAAGSMEEFEPFERE